MYRFAVPDLIIFVGIPGSGKSTFFEKNFATTHVHVSKDRMPNTSRRDERQEKMIADALAAGRDVVVDNTSPSRALREPLIAVARRCGARAVAYYFDCSVQLARARNRQREGKGRVPDVAIFVAAKKLQPPSQDEGFDEVHVVRCE